MKSDRFIQKAIANYTIQSCFATNYIIAMKYLEVSYRVHKDGRVEQIVRSNSAVDCATILDSTRKVRDCLGISEDEEVAGTVSMMVERVIEMEEEASE